jgi:hypothetical protein
LGGSKREAGEPAIGGDSNAAVLTLSPALKVSISRALKELSFRDEGVDRKGVEDHALEFLDLEPG